MIVKYIREIVILWGPHGLLKPKKCCQYEHSFLYVGNPWG